MTTLRGAIFDLDGVVVNTVPLHFKSWQYLFETVHGIPFSQKDYDDKVDGKPRPDSIKLFLPHLNAEEAIAAGEVKQEEYLKLLNERPIEQFPSTIKLIDELLSGNVIIAAASSSKNAVYILDKIGLLPKFTAVISGYDFVRGKPDPEIFLNAASAIKLPISECIVFEDALSGVQAAKAGGFCCVGIDRHGHPENYQTADLVVRDLAEVNFTSLEQLLMKSQSAK